MNTGLTMTVAEFARLVGVSESFVYDRVRAGDIPRVPNTGSRVLIARRWVDEHYSSALGLSNSPNLQTVSAGTFT